MAESEAATVTEDDVMEALEEVIDPELGLDFVSLGLVYDVEIENSDVYVTFTLTTPACPIGPQVSEQMKEFVGDLEGVTGVHPKMIFDPPWSPEMMTEDAKFALGLLTPEKGSRPRPRPTGLMRRPSLKVKVRVGSSDPALAPHPIAPLTQIRTGDLASRGAGAGRDAAAGGRRRCRHGRRAAQRRP